MTVEDLLDKSAISRGISSIQMNFLYFVVSKALKDNLYLRLQQNGVVERKLQQKVQLHRSSLHFNNLQMNLLAHNTVT